MAAAGISHWSPAPPPSSALSIICRRRRSVCPSYTNKDNLERQQSITAARKVTAAAAASAASARHRQAPPLPFFSFLSFNLFLLLETKGRRLFPLPGVCVVPRRKERKKIDGWCHFLDETSGLWAEFVERSNRWATPPGDWPSRHAAHGPDRPLPSLMNPPGSSDGD